MKFTKSQRVMHTHQYTPPCNLYNINKKQVTDLVTGSLQGPVTLSKDKNTFGFQRRFQNNTIQKYLPGPSEYFQDKKQIIYNFNKDLTKPQNFLKNTYRSEDFIPSIPHRVLNQDNYDEEDKKFLKQISLLQNPAKAADNIHRKEPSYSFSKSPRKASLILEKPNKHNNQVKNGEFLQSIPQKSSNTASINHGDSKNKKKSVIQHEVIKKATKRRNQIINEIGPNFIPSLQLVELMSKNRTKYLPGPGTYNTLKQDLINNNYDQYYTNKKGIAFPTEERFTQKINNPVGPGAYQINRDTSYKKGLPLSTQKRMLLQKDNTDLCYRFYINPDINSKNSLDNKSLRSQSCTNLKRTQQPLNAFGSNSKRFSLASTREDDKISVVSQYELEKQNLFKKQIRARIKKLDSQDRRSTKQDSGLLGISTLVEAIN